VRYDAARTQTAQKVGAARLPLAHLVNVRIGYVFDVRVCERYPCDAKGRDPEYRNAIRHVTRQIQIQLRVAIPVVYKEKISWTSGLQFDE
jgi:hypothetical protein